MGTSLYELIESIELRFKSGNSVPIERAHITSAEWHRLRGLINHAGSIVESRTTYATSMDADLSKLVDRS